MVISLVSILISFILLGLILTVQIVHYPSFKYVKDENFLDFHAHHSKSISIIVIPLMIFELLSQFFLWYQTGGLFWGVQATLNVLIWLSTFFLSVPIHHKLSLGRSENHIKKLVQTNWPRTIFWSLKSVVFVLFWESYV